MDVFQKDFCKIYATPQEMKDRKLLLASSPPTTEVSETTSIKEEAFIMTSPVSNVTERSASKESDAKEKQEKEKVVKLKKRINDCKKKKIGQGVEGEVWTTKDPAKGVVLKYAVIDKKKKFEKDVLEKEKDVYKELTKKNFKFAPQYKSCCPKKETGNVDEWQGLSQENTFFCMSYDKNYKPLFDDNSLDIEFKELLEAVQELHKLNITHNDLKPNNILLNTGPREEKPLFLLIDFGRSTRGRTTKLNAIVGTPYYMSPLMIRHRCPSFEERQLNDYWALSVIYYSYSFQTGDLTQTGIPFGKGGPYDNHWTIMTEIGEQFEDFRGNIFNKKSDNKEGSEYLELLNKGTAKQPTTTIERFIKFYKIFYDYYIGRNNNKEEGYKEENAKEAVKKSGEILEELLQNFSSPPKTESLGVTHKKEIIFGSLSIDYLELCMDNDIGAEGATAIASPSSSPPTATHQAPPASARRARRRARDMSSRRKSRMFVKKSLQRAKRAVELGAPSTRANWTAPTKGGRKRKSTRRTRRKRINRSIKS